MILANLRFRMSFDVDPRGAAVICFRAGQQAPHWRGCRSSRRERRSRPPFRSSPADAERWPRRSDAVRRGLSRLHSAQNRRSIERSSTMSAPQCRTQGAYPRSTPRKRPVTAFAPNARSRARSASVLVRGIAMRRAACRTRVFGASRPRAILANYEVLRGLDRFQFAVEPSEWGRFGSLLCGRRHVWRRSGGEDEHRLQVPPPWSRGSTRRVLCRDRATENWRNPRARLDDAECRLRRLLAESIELAAFGRLQPISHGLERRRIFRCGPLLREAPAKRGMMRLTARSDQRFEAGLPASLDNRRAGLEPAREGFSWS